MIGRLIRGVVALSMLGAGAAVMVFAAAFGAYALLEPHLGPAGAAGVLIGLVALAMILIGMMLMRSGAAVRRAVAPPAPPPASAAGIAGVIDRAMGIVRERPLTTAVVALAAGLMVIRNPQYLGQALRAFLNEGDQGRR